MGVIPRNENVMEEIRQILEELQSSYVVRQFTDLRPKTTVPRLRPSDPLLSAL